MKKLSIGILASLSTLLLTGAVLEEVISVNPGANIVATRIAGTWLLDAQMTRILNPDANVLSMKELEFTSDPAILKRLQNHGTAGNLFKNRRIFGAGIMTIDRVEQHPYVLVFREDDLKLLWFEPTNPSTDPLNPAGLIGSEPIFIAVSRSGLEDMMFLGGSGGASPRSAASCYGRG